METASCQLARAEALPYARRRPETTVLYQLVQEHAATFFAQVEAQTGRSLPPYVQAEFDAFLACGILAHGFLRLRCDHCHHEMLVAFSCKRRGFCPSCGARRMAETAAHLVDAIIPRVPVRQWVVSFPIPLRVLLAARPELITPVLGVVQRLITRYLIKQSGLPSKAAHTGAVTLIQRFGSAANLNIHLHCLVLDGVYTREQGEVVFHAVAAPSNQQLQVLLQKLIRRLMRCLVRTGALVAEAGAAYLSEQDSEDALSPLQAASITYRIAYGPRAGQKVLSLQTLPPSPPLATSPRCISDGGFSLHANTFCPAHDRQSLERLCRYITRPALADERLRINEQGQVVLKLKSPYRDGTTHVVMEPLEFMQRLAALVPRPRLNLIRFHGVLAPNHKLRSQVVPQGKTASEPEPAEDQQAGQGMGTPWRISWARLLKRVFNIDIEICPHCQGKLRIMAAITEASAIGKILTHQGLSAQPPPVAPARQLALFVAD